MMRATNPSSTCRTALLIACRDFRGAATVPLDASEAGANVRFGVDQEYTGSNDSVPCLESFEHDHLIAYLAPRFYLARRESPFTQRQNDTIRASIPDNGFAGHVHY